MELVCLPLPLPARQRSFSDGCRFKPSIPFRFQGSFSLHILCIINLVIQVYYTLQGKILSQCVYLKLMSSIMSSSLPDAPPVRFIIAEGIASPPSRLGSNYEALRVRRRGGPHLRANQCGKIINRGHRLQAAQLLGPLTKIRFGPPDRSFQMSPDRSHTLRDVRPCLLSKAVHANLKK